MKYPRHRNMNHLKLKPLLNLIDRKENTEVFYLNFYIL